MKALALATVLLLLAACTGAPTKPASKSTTRADAAGRLPVTTTVPRRSPYAPAQEDLGKRGNYTRGGLYAPDIQDSAPDGLPDVDLIPEPEVRNEPRSLYGNRSPYVVLGKSYSVLADPSNYEEVGLASYYGNKFHGRRTSDLEVYDMYAFSAAHKTLPLPSYARVTNLANGKSVIVRVNDRGPFHDGRIIDLSYAAAVKLGVDRAGTARVEVKGLRAGENTTQSDRAIVARTPAALPAGVHIATGIPTPARIEHSQPASAIDTLLSALPIASANAAEHPPQLASASSATPPPAGTVSAKPAAAVSVPQVTGERFDMFQNGHTMTADEFDQWMRSRRLHVATGKAAAAAAESATMVATPVIAPQQPATIAPSPSAIAAAMRPDQGSGDALTFQVASFAARINAERALAMLNGAGIGGARLLNAQANGRSVWRLRVGPVASASAQELLARIAGLGFGQPQRVRE